MRNTTTTSGTQGTTRIAIAAAAIAASLVVAAVLSVVPEDSQGTRPAATADRPAAVIFR